MNKFVLCLALLSRFRECEGCDAMLGQLCYFFIVMVALPQRRFGKTFGHTSISSLSVLLHRGWQIMQCAICSSTSYTLKMLEDSI